MTDIKKIQNLAIYTCAAKVAERMTTSQISQAAARCLKGKTPNEPTDLVELANDIRLRGFHVGPDGMVWGMNDERHGPARGYVLVRLGYLPGQETGRQMAHVITRDSRLGPQRQGGYRIQGGGIVSVICPHCRERHDFLGDRYRPWDPKSDDDIEKSTIRSTHYVTAPCGTDMVLCDVMLPGYVCTNLDNDAQEIDG